MFVAPANADEVLGIPANEGYDALVVVGHLQRLASSGHTFAAEPVSEQQRQQLYFESASQASRLRIQVSRVFGSQRQSGVAWFGTKVPALLVYEAPRRKLVGIYPHSRKGDPIDTTILSYLMAAA